jgi:acyl-coenzyme A thioesterase PaaI-like protein
MAAAKMSVAELERFLHEEFPQAFSDGDITIESADGETCLLRRRFDERMLRPGGTVSGPTLMAMADFAMYVVLLSAIGPVGLAVTTNLNINFLRKGQPNQDVLAAETRQTPCGWRGQSAVGDVGRSDRPCHGDLFHSNQIGFSEVLLHHIFKYVFLLIYFVQMGVDDPRAVL